MHQQIESKGLTHFLKLTINHYLNIHHVVVKLLLQIFIEIIRYFYILEHSRKLVDAIGRHTNMTKIFDIPCFFCLKNAIRFFSLYPLMLLDTSLYFKLLIKSFCFNFALGDSQSDIRLVSTRVNHSALT